VITGSLPKSNDSLKGRLLTKLLRYFFFLAFFLAFFFAGFFFVAFFFAGFFLAVFFLATFFFAFFFAIIVSPPFGSQNPFMFFRNHHNIYNNKKIMKKINKKLKKFIYFFIV